jgi:hypothetical protein
LVRLTNNATGHVFYARTHDHSTMGVATGAAVVSTTFDVSPAVEMGASRLEVVTNGIPSQTVSLAVNDDTIFVDGFENTPPWQSTRPSKRAR